MNNLSARKKGSMIAAAILLAFSLMLCVPTDAYAAKMNSQIWFHPSSKFQGNTKLKMQESMQNWNSYIPGWRRICYNSTTHSHEVFPTDDGNNYIYKEVITTNTDINAVGATKRYLNSSGYIASADICLNKNMPWSNDGSLTKYNVKTVMLHEDGHVLGLNDSIISSAVMYFQILLGQVKSITTQDTTALYNLYGTISPNSASDAQADPGLDEELVQLMKQYPSANVSLLDRTYGRVTKDDLFDSAEVIAVGTVIGKSDPFIIAPANGADPSYFTDYYFKIDELPFGAIQDQKTGQALNENVIAVRIEGGAGEHLISFNESSPDLSIGGQYTLFLAHAYSGEWYNTEGNHYYLVGGSKAPVWRYEGGTYVSNDSSVGRLTGDELAAACESAQERYPFERRIEDNRNWIERKESRLLENVMSGFATEESLVEDMEQALYLADHFGRVISDEEYAALYASNR